LAGLVRTQMELRILQKPGNISISVVIFSCRIREFVLVYTSIPLRSEIPHLYLSHNRIYLVYLGLLFDF